MTKTFSIKMTRVLFCLAFVLFFTGFAQAQEAQTMVGDVVRPIAQSNGWSAFWTDFRAAVKKRDRKALRRMMANDFIVDENGSEMSIDDTFKFFDDPSVRGWAALSEVVNKGAVAMPNGCYHNGKFYKECRTAPNRTHSRFQL